MTFDSSVELEKIRADFMGYGSAAYTYDENGDLKHISLKDVCLTAPRCKIRVKSSWDGNRQYFYASLTEYDEKGFPVRTEDSRIMRTEYFHAQDDAEYMAFEFEKNFINS